METAQVVVNAFLDLLLIIFADVDLRAFYLAHLAFGLQSCVRLLLCIQALLNEATLVSVENTKDAFTRPKLALQLLHQTLGVAPLTLELAYREVKPIESTQRDLRIVDRCQGFRLIPDVLVLQEPG